MPPVNKAWHDSNVLPKSATTAQRIAWHVEHQQRCGCRPIPKRLREQMEAAMTPKAPSTTSPFVQVGELPPGFDLPGAFLPQDAKRVLVYLLPIRMSWGPAKLRTIIVETLDEDADEETAYVFANAKRDTLLVYWLDADGERTMQRRKDKGSFIWPVYADGERWARVHPKKLRSLLRTDEV